MLTVSQTWNVSCELNDGPLNLRVTRENLVTFVNILLYNNARMINLSVESSDWEQWPRLGTIPLSRND